MPQADRYKLDLTLIIEGVFKALDNNVGIYMETLSIVDDLDLFFSYPWGRILYGRLIRDFRGRWARKFLDTTKKKEKAISYTVHDFPIAVQLHVYVTLRPTEIERGQPHIATLVLFDDRPVPALDDLVRNSVAPQFYAERLGTAEEGTFEDETSDEAHKDSGPVARRRSTVYLLCPTNCNGRIEPHDRRYSGHVDGSKNSHRNEALHREAQNHATRADEFKKLKDFISTVSSHPALQPLHVRLMWTSNPDNQTTEALQTMQATTRRLTAMTKTWGLTGKRETASAYFAICSFGVAEGGHHPLPGDRDKEQDMLPTGIEHLQDTADIEPCPDNDPVPVLTRTDEVQDIPSFIEN
ncbi:Hypothetical predicted protein [Olea europaea subsp. europaea]|uniref:DUF1985 domain-containing protein n=1 Tax=Olea europaea subsp. europaea TaxID=158383 RepID=A0A8S0PF22_OLEEU|nr:Hypothetical predicted protein [Olea europaea subsp. europaea]